MSTAPGYLAFPRYAATGPLVAFAAYAFGVESSDLVGPGQHRPLVRYRLITAAALRDVTDLSFPGIAEALGWADHTSAIYACQRVATDPQLRETKDRLVADFRASAVSGDSRPSASEASK